jgi:hypothetical protein
MKWKVLLNLGVVTSDSIEDALDNDLVYSVSVMNDKSSTTRWGLPARG